MRPSFQLPCALRYAAMAAGLLCLSALPALADACGEGVSMSATTVAVRPDYDFTDGAQHTTVVTSLRVMGVVAGCTYLVGAEGGNGGRKMTDGAAHTANYQIYANSQLTNLFLDPLNGASGTDVNMLGFTGGSATTVTLTYYLTMPAGQYVPSGLYQDDVLLTLYSGTFLEPSPPIDSVSAIHETTVTGLFLLSLVPTGNAFDINQTSIVTDFGTLAPGQSRSVQALFKSNDSVGYKVYMRSDNGSRLKPANGAASIPYSVTLSPSNSPNLTAVTSGPALTPTDIQVATGTGAAPATADRLNVTATIGSFSVPALVPGAYSDVITVTIVGN